MEKILNFFKTKNIGYYVCLAFAVLSIITSIIYVSSLQPISDYLNYGVFTLLLFAGLSFIGLSIFQLDKIGAALMAALNFGGFILYLITIYNYPLTQLMTTPDLFKIPYIGTIITIAVLNLISAIGGNVFAYLDTRKVNKEESK